MLCFLQPTQQLLRFFRAGDYDVTDQIAVRIDQMAHSVLPQEPASQHALHALQVAMTNERRSQVLLSRISITMKALPVAFVRLQVQVMLHHVLHPAASIVSLRTVHIAHVKCPSLWWSSG